jgi:predicted ferric reductase
MQLPLIVGLASKNNVLSAITGISYEKLNYLHRAAGRVCVLTTWIHWAKWVEKGLGKHGPGTEIFLTGVLGATALTLMFLSSFALVRRIAYEFFLLVHILMGVIFLVAVYFHSPNRWFQHWVWPSLFLWGLDRFVSFGRMVVVNKAWLLPFRSKREQHSACTVELVSPEVLRLRVRRPLFRWSAGQHAFITMPGVALLRYEQHPFTIANIPDATGEAVFLIRAQTGFTRRLVDRLTSTKDEINCYLDGPYGTPHDLNHYGGVLLVAGGTGVTHVLAHLAAIVKASREGASACSVVRLAWNVREEEAVAWIAPMLNTALAEGTGNVRVCVDIFVTRSHLADEPNAEECPVSHHPHAGNEDTPGETPMFSPDETPAHTPGGSPKELSPRSSSEAIEKGVKNENVSKALRYSLTGPAAAAVAFHRGRSNVEMLLRTDIDAVPADTAGVAVGVCGPTTLMLDARRAVCSVNSAGAVLKGQTPIDLYSETFGW